MEENKTQNPEHLNEADLFLGKDFSSWDSCDAFLDTWAKKEGFYIVKSRVHRDNGIIRRRAYICVHGRTHNSSSEKDTSTKKINCPFLVNAHLPKAKNPESSVIITKIVREHNHSLNVQRITHEEEKKFTEEILADIEFLTHCKFGATMQRKYLEAKYPAHPIYSKDLYATIQKFRPTAKSLSNDAARISNWLDEQKDKDPRWVIARGWDDDNTMTHLFWMTPDQVQNWIRFCDCVLNDVTHKTNRYGMPLSLFVGFNQNRENVLLAQALLMDESVDSHIWMFRQIMVATE